MQTVQMNSIELSRIVQGFWRLTDWNMSTDELVAFMRQCVDLGVTTFDTAEIYGGTECEAQMGRAFAKDPSLRKSVQLVSKTGIFREGDFGYYNTTYDRVMTSCRESLERLECDYLDLYLIHREDPCFDPWETGRALKDLKKQGLVKEIGVSNFDPFKFNALNTAVDGTLVSNQIEWNPFCFEHFASGMIDLLAEKKISPMIWSPLAGGALFVDQGEMYQNAQAVLEEIAGRYGVSVSTIVYAWLLYHPVKALPISGSNKIDRLKEAIAGLDLTLDHWEWYKIYAASGQRVLR